MAIRVTMTEVYRDWIGALKDTVGRARIQVRIERLTHGNPGTIRRISAEVSELKINYGPGYRVYYTQMGDELIVLLTGGNKSTQQRDIRTALRLTGNL